MPWYHSGIGNVKYFCTINYHIPCIQLYWNSNVSDSDGKQWPNGMKLKYRLLLKCQSVGMSLICLAGKVRLKPWSVSLTTVCHSIYPSFWLLWDRLCFKLAAVGRWTEQSKPGVGLSQGQGIECGRGDSVMCVKRPVSLHLILFSKA